MTTAKIIPMSEEYRDKLIEYMHKKYPTFTDAYIQYDVNEAIGTPETGTKSIIVVNDNDEIVGCHLCFITKAWIKGKEELSGCSVNFAHILLKGNCLTSV